MLICKKCYDDEETKLPYEPDEKWADANKVYEQCDFCELTTLCAEL